VHHPKTGALHAPRRQHSSLSSSIDDTIITLTSIRRLGSWSPFTLTMTILGKYDRRKAHKNLISRGATGGSAKKGLFKGKLGALGGGGRKRNPTQERMIGLQVGATEKPTVGTETMKAIQVEVTDLIRSGSGSDITVVAMANALAGSGKVISRHAAVEPQDNIMTKITRGIRNLAFPQQRKKEAEALKRKYQLVAAFNKLEKLPESRINRISSWSDARKVLSSVIELPEDDAPTDLKKADEDESDSVDKWIHRVEETTRKERVDELVPCVSKWKQVAVVPNLEGKSAMDKADEMLVIRLGDEFENHQARLDGKPVKDVERRMIEKENAAEAKKKAASLMRPLTGEEQQIVKEAMYGMGPSNEVIVKSGADSVQRGSIQTLQPGQWLNDEVIHYFYEMLAKRDEEMCQHDPSRKRCHFFKSFFITKLLNEGNSNPDLDGKYDYQNVKRWSKKVPGKDLFNLDKIIFPINEGRMHWLCAVAFMQDKRIQMYDSMGSNGMHYLESLLQYVKDEHQAKKGTPLPDAHEWRLVPCESDTPRQRNGKLVLCTEC
jgi:sentrin-specific protease 1